MFCYQCEQTFNGSGCTVKGVCQKDARLAALQDYLVFIVQELASVSDAAVRGGKHIPRKLQMFLFQALFATLTNVNFSHEDIFAFIQQCHSYIKALNPETRMVCPISMDDAVEKAQSIGIPVMFRRFGELKTNLTQLSIIASKGLSAYAYHAMVLGSDSLFPVFSRLCQILGHDLRLRDTNAEFLGLVAQEVGRLNVEVMEILHNANTGAYGNPMPIHVDWIRRAEEGSLRPGPAILCSGHDLFALDCLLQQAERHGVQVYTHGELLPAHGYPHFRDKLAGHFGTAWQNQRKDFLDFPGPVVVTTNCFMPPPASYAKKVFTCPPVAASQTQMIRFHDFSEVIEMALGMEGFGERPREAEDRKLLVGFGLHTLQQTLPRLITALEDKDISRIYVIGGCDGSERVRNQFTELARALPSDTLIMTMGCGKYKINDMDYGTVAGIPRLLDLGQCNDAFVGVVLASALAKHFEAAINDLPLTFVVSWFEQKAVAILLSLLSLGIKNIYLGPRLPAFFSPPIVDYLQKEHYLHLFNDAKQLLWHKKAEHQQPEVIHKTEI